MSIKVAHPKKTTQKTQDPLQREEFGQFVKMVDERFNEVDERFKKVDERFNKIDRRFDAIEEKMKEFPTKTEIYSKLDAILFGIQSYHQEQDVLSYQVSRLNDIVGVRDK